MSDPPPIAHDSSNASAALIARLDGLRELQRAIWNELCDIQDELASRPSRPDDQP
jgi:hypothetical protein